jgi:hypothetical protein
MRQRGAPSSSAARPTCCLRPMRTENSIPTASPSASSPTKASSPFQWQGSAPPSPSARADALQLRRRFGPHPPGAYERLLLEAIAGDATLSSRDEVEIAWQIADSIRPAGGQAATNREFYARRTWGPSRRMILLARPATRGASRWSSSLPLNSNFAHENSTRSIASKPPLNCGGGRPAMAGPAHETAFRTAGGRPPRGTHRRAAVCRVCPQGQPAKSLARARPFFLGG